MDINLSPIVLSLKIPEFILSIQVFFRKTKFALRWTNPSYKEAAFLNILVNLSNIESVHECITGDYFSFNKDSSHTNSALKVPQQKSEI